MKSNTSNQVVSADKLNTGFVTEGSVTFSPAPHPPIPFDPSAGLKSVPNEDPALTIFRCVYPKFERKKQPTELLQTSVSRNTSFLDDVITQKNGFVNTVIDAYNTHRALIIRPDDVWLAILVQFNFFVNGNAELLRKNFVSHEGKEKLTVTAVGNRHSVDFAALSAQMTLLMERKIVDPDLREWIMPTFSTTSATDRTIYAMVMMASMKAYFSYKFSLRCGIPRVTLEGTKKDWEEMASRLEKLEDYGEDAKSWYRVLWPVISRFISAYDDPNSPELRDFWNKVAHFEGGGSGPTYLSGWITAFCFFSEKGSRVAQLTGKQLVLDGVSYPMIDSQDVPVGFAEVDVELDDNGEKFETTIIAGSVGSQICMGTSSVRDAIRPLPAWWYAIMEEVKPDKMHRLR
ncbi:hypothetical protein F5887DRAFT_1047970 [Amanita rubescens]|nr:hypothetical protein F5887DRAFT_1047970 [Amanita rubescens]